MDQNENQNENQNETETKTKSKHYAAYENYYRGINQCPCGGTFTNTHKKQHGKTQKHKRYLLNLPPSLSESITT